MLIVLEKCKVHGLMPKRKIIVYPPKEFDTSGLCLGMEFLCPKCKVREGIKTFESYEEALAYIREVEKCTAENI
jgi:phage FluMu protein Com